MTAFDRDYRPAADEPRGGPAFLVGWVGGFIWGVLVVLAFVQLSGGF
ncbi:MAG: hypothetical protein Q8N51_00675 [Gammaproteobacteria bacterium]|nr:hypothetical protein [Gammaproteobacteria bacterium]